MISIDDDILKIEKAKANRKCHGCSNIILKQSLCIKWFKYKGTFGFIRQYHHYNLCRVCAKAKSKGVKMWYIIFFDTEKKYILDFIKQSTNNNALAFFDIDDAKKAMKGHSYESRCKYVFISYNDITYEWNVA